MTDARLSSRPVSTLVLAAVLAALCSSPGCSSDDAGCKSDSDCKGDRICESGRCVSPSGSGGGGFGGGGGTGGSGAVGGSGGCAPECKTPAGTCCAGPNVCQSVPPCVGNPCCDPPTP